MTRGTFIFLICAVVLLTAAYFGLPILKRTFLGESLQVRHEVTMVEDDYEVKYKNHTVSRTVVGLEILFPMGGAPDNINDLEVRGSDGQPVTVEWSTPDKQDIVDERITKWTIREAFFPIGFRQGMLRTKHRDLFYLRLPPVPFRK